MSSRIIGEFNPGRPGPTVLCTGGMHGSEPAGVFATERIIKKLKKHETSFRGSFKAVRGNISALDQGQRYLDKDLNRLWKQDAVDRLLVAGETPDKAIEYKEMKEIALILRETIKNAKQPINFIDLHTTSSECLPFFWLIPSRDVQDILPRFDLPIVYDSFTHITGTLGQYVASLGHQALLAEGGQHDSPLAVDHCEAILWMTLVRVGCLDEDAVRDEYEESCALLKQARGETPRYFNIVYHHKLPEKNSFRMKPGFRSFQAVRKGDVIAEDHDGEIIAPENGRLLMPLYRPPCEDGFMIIRKEEAWPDTASWKPHS